MKFCKNLAQVIDLSDPAWAPYFLNYKQLKKMLKNLPTFGDPARAQAAAAMDSEASSVDEASTMQRGGDATNESGSKTSKRSRDAGDQQLPRRTTDGEAPTPPLGQNPEEVAFFKFLHKELKKAEFFFEEATQEFQIRERRVRKGINIAKCQLRSMVDDKWKTMSKAMYLLYKDLLLLETFAIMTYVGFSKILKKHDKVTGYRTCNAYMEGIVNQSNFTHYPKVMSMILSAQRHYGEITAALEHEGKLVLSEDEQLFINMIHKLNEEVLSDDDNSAKGHFLNGKTEHEVESTSVGDLRELLEDDSSQAAEPAEIENDDIKLPPKKRVAR